MKVIKTKLEGVLIIKPDVYKDERGYFTESYNKKKYNDFGITCDFVQDNHSRSIKGVIRGLHYQTYPGQAKLVRCTKGRIWDVAVDIRKESKTYQNWVSIELSEENKKQFFIPRGYAHGFAALDDINDVQYKCDSFYNKETESQIKWNDPDINIKWPVVKPILSNRDKF